ncbi:protein krueppel-like [Homarus americanus]|uniref:protein krueppel-like n=1 Tax=Homarus americanus TaxID=6706 RepID=UPI001C45E887|nr:protein krueppel-like [Homarus americanus]
MKVLMNRSEARRGEEASSVDLWSKLSSSVFSSVGAAGSGAIKSHQCLYCPYTTNIKCNLLRHERTHTGEKPYPCPHCNFRCSQNCDLKKHIRIHTGEKPFACEHCPYRSSRKEVLRSHMRIHATSEGN